MRDEARRITANIARDSAASNLQLRQISSPVSAVAVGTLNSQDFYTRLERCIERSERVLNARLIEGRVIEGDG
jgi:hypothetical protein